MRLVAYLRVSTAGQAEDGYGLDAQRSAVEDWAQREGHSVVQWCEDAGVSGTVPAADRDGFRCVLGMLAAGAADGVVLAKVDRLARKLVVQEDALSRVWALGARVFTTETGEVVEKARAMETAMRQMTGVWAELDRAMIVERLSAGRRAKSEKGGYAFGAPPFGWRARGGELVPDPREAEVVATMLELSTEGLGYRAIARELNARGIAPRGTRKAGREYDGPPQWHATAVRRVLARSEA